MLFGSTAERRTYTCMLFGIRNERGQYMLFGSTDETGQCMLFGSTNERG